MGEHLLVGHGVEGAVEGAPRSGRGGVPLAIRRRRRVVALAACTVALAACAVACPVACTVAVAAVRRSTPLLPVVLRINEGVAGTLGGPPGVPLGGLDGVGVVVAGGAIRWDGVVVAGANGASDGHIGRRTALPTRGSHHNRSRHHRSRRGGWRRPWKGGGGSGCCSESPLSCKITACFGLPAAEHQRSQPQSPLTSTTGMHQRP